MPSRSRFLLVVLAALLWAAASAGASETEPRQPAAGGALSWLGADELDLFGDLWVDLPFSLGRQSFGFSLDTRLAMQKPEDDVTFLVRDLQYAIDLRWEQRPLWLDGHRWFAFGGQQGEEAVDADGQAFVQYAGIGFASAPDRERWRWRIMAAPVFNEQEVQADALVRGGVRWAATRIGDGPLRLDLDLELDALIDDGRLRAELCGGPRIGLPVSDGRLASLFLHYHRGRNPLGTEDDFWLVGFAYEEGHGAGPPGSRPPEIDGRLTAGGGEGRGTGTLLLRMLSPAFAGEHRVVFQVDGNVLTAEDTGELYYRYHLGVERALERLVRGAWFYHRSNHQLAEPGEVITSINVLEVGIETQAWTRPGRRTGRGWRAIDGVARVGYLIDSSFGEERRWHARGGLRWSAPVKGRVQPYLFAALEAGDVEGESYAFGLAFAERAELQLEYRDDEQYFGSDRTAWLLTATYGF